MKRPNNLSETFEAITTDIERGDITIPQFQRQFVWNVKQSASLIDSILKGYPIGNFIFWKTREELRSVRSIGDIVLDTRPSGDIKKYILDGQQRITSIYAVLKGAKIKIPDGNDKFKLLDYSNVFIDFDASEDEEIAITDIEGKDINTYIKVLDLVSGTRAILQKHPDKYEEKINMYRQNLYSYPFPITLLSNPSIDVATEVFTRLNVGGKSLTLFEIMVAKTYDEKKNFDLNEKYGELMGELRNIQYDTIPDITILQVVSVLLCKDSSRKKILAHKKNDIINIWDDACKAIKSSIELFRGSYGVRVSRLLPYNALLVVFSYYFYIKKDKPTGEVKNMLTDLFWRISLGYRYSSTVDTYLSQDIERVDKIIKGELPRYTWRVEIEPQNIIDHGEFSTGKSYVKAILAILASQQPRSFDNHALVNIDNDYLKIATSKNYHHFFPKSYMEKNQKNIEYRYVNNIVNITIVDDFLNKIKIKAKRPSVYMEEFIKENDQIECSMSSHLIGDFETFGIFDNEFVKFIEERSKLISKEIKKYLLNYSPAAESSNPSYYAMEDDEVLEDK